MTSPKFRNWQSVQEEVRRRIHATTQLTASAGVAPNKFLAKVASDMRKPDGLFVVRPEDVESFVRELPIRKVPGIGKVTEKSCNEQGIKLCGDFLHHSEEELIRLFGKSGRWFHAMARGIDDRPVCSTSVRKSQSVEDTFAADLTTRDAVRAELLRLADVLEKRLVKSDTKGQTVTLKVKYSDFTIVTRSRTVEIPVQTKDALLHIGLDLLETTEVGARPVRLIGIGVSNLVGEGDEEQLYLPFDELT